MPSDERIRTQHKVLADFGDVALQSEDLGAVLKEACRLVAEALGTSRAKVLEIEKGGESLFVRAGVGWAPGVVGHVRLPMDEHSSETYAVRLGQPVISRDIGKEDRFDLPDFLKEAGIVALVNVPILRPGGQAFGLLQVDDTVPRDFDGDDIAFLRTYAAVLGLVIDRLLKLEELRASEERFGAFVTASNDMVYRISPDLREMRDLRGRGLLADLSRSGQDWQEHFVHPEDREMVRTAIENVSGDEDLVELEHRVRLPRRTAWVLSRAVPIRDAEGRTLEWLGAAQDVTDRREAEERRSLVLRLADRLGTLDDPVVIEGEATRLLREHFGAVWCYYVEWDKTGTGGTVLRDSTRDGHSSLIGRRDLSDLPDGFLRSGGLLRVPDISTHQLLSPHFVERYTGLGVRAILTASLVRNGRLVASLSVADASPREWSDNEVMLVEEVAARTWAAVERARAEAGLRASEERFRAIVETATDYAIFTIDPDGRIETWPRGAELVFGWTAEEAVGQPVEMTFTPEDRKAGAPQRERQEARDTGQARDVRWHLRKDGSRVFIEGAVRPLHGPDNLLKGFVKVGQDVTRRRATQEALRESEGRFRQFGEASSDALWIRDCETLAYEYVSPAFEVIYGVSLEHVFAGNNLRRWAEMILPEDREKVLNVVRRVRQGETVTHDFRILRPDGEVRWIRDTDFPLRDAQGHVQRIGGIAHDATDEIDLQNRLKVLVAELQHRTRNLMGVVRSVTDKTLSSSISLEDFQSRIRDRLGALSRVNSLLSRLDGGHRITFDDLLLTELKAHGVVDPADASSQVALDGPEGIRLRSSTVQTLALGLHELATNALKYGALSRPEGQLDVTWSLVDGNDGERRLRVDWRESGVAVSTPAPEGGSGGKLTAPRRRGYGRELIERALPYQLKAETAYELTPQGVRCTITLPVSSTMDETDLAQESING